MIDWWKEEVKWISILPRSAIWKLYLRKACRPKSVGPALIASKAACRSWRKEATSRSTSGTLSGAKWDIRLLNERWYSLLSLPELTTPCTGMANIALIPCLKTLLLHAAAYQENFLVPGSFSADVLVENLGVRVRVKNLMNDFSSLTYFYLHYEISLLQCFLEIHERYDTYDI